MGRQTITRYADIGFVLFIVLCLILSVLSLRYHGRTIEREAISTQSKLAEIHTRAAVEHLAQTITTVDLLMRSLLESGYAERSSEGWKTTLGAALINSPQLRSLSLLDDSGRIVISTNGENLGLIPTVDDYLPDAAPHSDLLRVGPPHHGRDLADGREILDWSTAPPDIGFVPVSRSLWMGEGPRLSLIAVLNTDFFLNRLTHREAIPIEFDVVRYDGRMLFSSSESSHAALHAGADHEIAALWREGLENGVLRPDPDEGMAIVAHRVDTRLPIGVIARIDLNAAVMDARSETRSQQITLLPIILVALIVVLVAYLMFRRIGERQFRMQQTELTRFGQLLDTLPAAVLLFDDKGQLILSNRTWRETGLNDAQDHAPKPAAMTIDDLANKLALDAVHPVLAAAVPIRDVLAGQSAAFDAEFSATTHSGPRHFQLMVRPFAPASFRGVTMLLLDVTRRREAEQESRLLRAAVNSAPSGIVITDIDAHIEWANPAFASLTGYEVEEALGRRPAELVRSGLQSREFYKRMWDTIRAGQVWRGEVINKRKDESLYHESLTIAPVSNERGVIEHYVAIKEDISERKRLEERLIELARTDPLTGVANRRAFLESLGAELDRMRRHAHPVSVLMLDIDFFKQVNDQHGHAAGDQVLKIIANLLRGTVRTTDALGRLGGEEFAIATVEADGAAACELAERIRSAVEMTRIDTCKHMIKVTISIGVAVAHCDDSADTVLSRADTALYAAKSSGRNRVVRARDLSGDDAARLRGQPA